jgi:transcriptional regulator with XRE-family HTH domain
MGLILRIGGMTPMSNGNFGEWLRIQRQLRGLTQEELAQQAHTAQRTVSSWELGKRTPGFLAMGYLAFALGISLNNLWSILAKSKGREVVVLPNPAQIRITTLSENTEPWEPQEGDYEADYRR